MVMSSIHHRNHLKHRIHLREYLMVILSSRHLIGRNRLRGKWRRGIANALSKRSFSSGKKVDINLIRSNLGSSKSILSKGLSNKEIIEGYSRFIMEHVKEGWDAYLLTFMFNFL